MLGETKKKAATPKVTKPPVDNTQADGSNTTKAVIGLSVLVVAAAGLFYLMRK